MTGIEGAIDRVDQVVAVAGRCALTGVCGFGIKRIGSLLPLFAGGILNRRYAWDSAALVAIPLSMLAVLAIIAGSIVLSERLLKARYLRVAVLTASALVTAFCFPHGG